MFRTHLIEAQVHSHIFQKHLRSPRLRRAFVFLISIIRGAGSAKAQSSQITGQVIDSGKAAISGAKLTAIQGETGDQRHAVSGSEGYYSFPLLPPGHYELTAASYGSQAQYLTGIVVVTGTNTTVNVTLRAGEAAQTVSVDAISPLLQTESSAVAKVVKNQTIVDMPLLDRRASQLQRLNGFVVGNGSGSNATFATAGGRSNNGRDQLRTMDRPILGRSAACATSDPHSLPSLPCPLRF
jgi:hypothetical protein